MILRWLFASLLTFMLVACNKEKPYKPPVPQTDKATASPIFQDQIKSMEKAKGVEQTLEKHNQEEQKAIDQESR